MSKFTKGEWRVDRDTISECWIVSDYTDVVCMVSEENYHDSSDEQKANANLISAAPNMYRALEVASIWLKSCLSCEAFNWDDDQREAAEQSLETANKALAKARGDYNEK